MGGFIHILLVVAVVMVLVNVISRRRGVLRDTCRRPVARISSKQTQRLTLL